MLRTDSDTAQTGDTRLTEREERVVRLIARGYSNKEAAARMGVSHKTVETFKARAMKKLGLKTRVALGTVRRPAGAAEPGRAGLGLKRRPRW